MLSKILNTISDLVAANKGMLFIALILVFANLPYIVNIQQDLITEPIANPIVCHDEAAFGMNAKDILLFGYSSLAHDRIYVLGLLNLIITLISFLFFGISLSSLRLPYIIFNIIGNIFFFDFLRRVAGKKIAVAVACLFALFASRVIIGKSAMAEASILPVLLIMSWAMPFASKNARLYFFLGFLSMLAGFTKPDNLAAFVILIVYAFFDDIEERRDMQKITHFLRTRWLFTGAVFMIFIWAIYIGIIGFKRALFYYKFELLLNNIRALKFGFHGNPGTFELVKNNMVKLWAWDPLFMALTCILVAAAVIYSFFDRDAIRNQLMRAGFLFFGLFISKIAFSSYLVGQWRMAPCYPLPFLALGYICIILLKLSKVSSINCSLKRYCLRGSIFLGICFLCYISPFIYKSIQLTRKLIFQPTYKIIKNVEYLRKTLNPNFRIIFAEGHFTYCALFLPNKCYDIIPNIEAKDPSVLESDPQRIADTIEMDKQIVYLMVRPVNKTVMDFVNSIPQAKLLITDALPFEAGYVYQIRWHQDAKEVSQEFSGG